MVSIHLSCSMNKQQAQFDARLTMALAMLGGRRAIKTLSATVTPGSCTSTRSGPYRSYRNRGKRPLDTVNDYVTPVRQEG
jgi:hypothetical protein